MSHNVKKKFLININSKNFNIYKDWIKYIKLITTRIFYYQFILLFSLFPVLTKINKYRPYKNLFSEISITIRGMENQKIIKNCNLPDKIYKNNIVIENSCYQNYVCVNGNENKTIIRLIWNNLKSECHEMFSK